MVILTWNFWEITQRFLHFGRNDERSKAATAGKTTVAGNKTATAGKTTLAGKTRITEKDVEITDVA